MLAACLLLAAGTVTLPCRLRAQLPEFLPYGGVVVPTSKLIQQGRASLAHRTQVAFGARLDYWVSRSTGLEVVASYAPSGYRRVDTTGTARDTVGGLLHATGRLLYRVVQRGPWSAHVLAGAGVAVQGGAYLGGATGKTSLCGVVGAAARLRASAGWTLQLTAEDYVYSARLGGFADVPGAAGKLNNDLVLSLGVTVPLGARGEEDY
jgi:hypothetical protein